MIGSDDEGTFLYLASLDSRWERLVDQPGANIRFARTSGEFVRREIDFVGDGVYVMRADGSLLEGSPGRHVDGRRVWDVVPGGLGRNELALAVRLEESTVHHLYMAELPPIAVGIDVRPRRATNRIHPRSRRSIPIAIFGSETFPVDDMDVTSIGIGPGAAPARGRPKLRDANDDGWTDLVLRFRPRDAGIARGDSEVCLSGETHDGIGFEGCDAVTLGR